MTVTPGDASLGGRTAVVTGAARGLGAAMAHALAAFGADVALCDREADDLAAVAAAITSTGGHATTAVLDVRSADDVDAWIASLPRVDILVNNAGGGFHAAFDSISPKGQQALVDENFTSVTHLIRACTKRMEAGGSIINVTSVEAFRAAPGFSIYAAMKAAVEQLTRTLALELSGRGIRVNCVAPDAIPTPGDEALAGASGALGYYSSVVPLGLGTADDCAAAVVFLAGGLARFITGSTIHVDGGTDAARGWRRQDGRWTP